MPTALGRSPADKSGVAEVHVAVCVCACVLVKMRTHHQSVHHSWMGD